MQHKTSAMRKFYRFLAAAVGVTGLVLAFGAYFLVSTSGSGNVYDFWGRRLYESPLVMRIAGLPDYPGLYWFAADFVIAIALVSLVAKLWSLGQESTESGERSLRE